MIMAVGVYSKQTGCRVSGVGCRVSGVGCRVSDVGCRMSDVGGRCSLFKALRGILQRGQSVPVFSDLWVESVTKRTVFTLILAAFAIHAWPFFLWVSGSGFQNRAFVPPPRNAAANGQEPSLKEHFIIPGQKGRMVHVASICEISKGNFAASWYGGTREGAGDVAIFLSFFPSREKAVWTDPQVVVDRASASKELYRYVKKVGNPILFTDSMSRLWMLFVTVRFGGWSCSSINVKISEDFGKTWTPTRQLTLSPFLNISELVRNNQVPLQNGAFGVPIYHEFIGYFPEMLWIKPEKETSSDFAYRKTRIIGGREYQQPAVAVFDEHSACAFYRCRTEIRAVGRSITMDGGTRWSSAERLEQANPDASLDVLPLSDGRFLMVYNDHARTRENLRLALSNDRGKSWQAIATLEDTPEEEFSYPYMIRSDSGDIHLVYTWKRKRIKHLVFNEAWIHYMEKSSMEKRTGQ